MKHTKESVQARIAELVEDVKKLEFGCQVKDKENKVHRVLDFDEDMILIQYLVPYENWYHVNEFEIIGRDATLADVLRAIWETGRCLRVDERGTIELQMPTLGSKNNFCYWNLSLPLSGQSQEVIDFIGEILK